jgi:hypothetical protein
MSEEVMIASCYIMSDVSIGMHVISVHRMLSLLGTILKHIRITGQVQSSCSLVKNVSVFQYGKFLEVRRSWRVAAGCKPVSFG